MEDLPLSDDSHTNSPLPEAGNDPGDPLAPSIEEEDSTPNPPIADPTADMEVTGTNEVDKDDEDEDDDFDDNESLLSEVDEAQFEDFNPDAITIEDRPQVAIDDSNVKLLGVHKRKRTEAEIEESRRKKRKEKGRERPKKPRKRRDGSEPFSGGEELNGKRSRRKKGDGEKGGSSRAPKVVEDVDESELTPEESTFSSICTANWRFSVLMVCRTATRSRPRNGRGTCEPQ
jgi:transcription factor SPN1